MISQFHQDDHKLKNKDRSRFPYAGDIKYKGHHQNTNLYIFFNDGIVWNSKHIVEKMNNILVTRSHLMDALEFISVTTWNQP